MSCKLELLELYCAVFLLKKKKDYDHKHSVFNFDLLSLFIRFAKENKTVTFKGIITQSSIC